MNENTRLASAAPGLRQDGHIIYDVPGEFEVCGPDPLWPLLNPRGDGWYSCTSTRSPVRWQPHWLPRFIMAIALPRFKQGEAYSEEANNLPRLLDEAPFPCGAGAEEDACHVAALPVDPRPHTLSSTKKRSVHRSSIARRR